MSGMKPDIEPGVKTRRFLLRGEALGGLIVKPFQEFASIESAGGILMIGATVAALIWMNSSLGELYEKLLHAPLTVGVADSLFRKEIHFWINEGLMALFFFVVGLEIKREVLVGELGSLKQALLPAAGAIGGVIAPSLIYYAINRGGPGEAGWGVPMATDIAFVLGAITVLGPRVPSSLGLFLVSLAIVDDLTAVIVIALFYTTEIQLHFLNYAGMVLIGLVGMNILGFRRPFPYLILGVILWYLVYKSGIHATVTGVIVALTIPARSSCDTHEFADNLERLAGGFERQGGRGFVFHLKESNQIIIRSLERLCLCVEPPLQRLEHLLHPVVTFAIMPVFALSNAGIPVSWELLNSSLTGAVPIGVVLGLFVGKQVGVFGGAWLAVKSGLAELPKDLSFRDVYGGAMLCGIGFTMSLFIANLSFEPGGMLDEAKLGILLASTISAIGGMWVLSRPRPKRSTQSTD